MTIDNLQPSKYVLATILLGYSIQVMLEMIEEMSLEKLHGGDFVFQFDLVAGVSVGGVAALMCSQNELK